MKFNIKILIILLVGLVVLIFAWSYLNRYLQRSRATNPIATISIWDGATMLNNINLNTSVNNGEKILTIKINTNSATNKISGFSFNLLGSGGVRLVGKPAGDPRENSLIDTLPAGVTEVRGFVSGGGGYTVAVLKGTPMTEISIPIKIKGTSTGCGYLTFVQDSVKVVGNIPSYTFDTAYNGITNGRLLVGTNYTSCLTGTPSPTPTLPPTTALVTPICTNFTQTVENNKLRLSFNFRGNNPGVYQIYPNCTYTDNLTPVPAMTITPALTFVTDDTTPGRPYPGDSSGSFVCYSGQNLQTGRSYVGNVGVQATNPSSPGYHLYCSISGTAIVPTTTSTPTPSLTPTPSVALASCTNMTATKESGNKIRLTFNFSGNNPIDYRIFPSCKYQSTVTGSTPITMNRLLPLITPAAASVFNGNVTGKFVCESGEAVLPGTYNVMGSVSSYIVDSTGTTIATSIKSKMCQPYPIVIIPSPTPTPLP